MATTEFSDLQSDLQARLGYGSVSASELSRIKQCLNGAIAELSVGATSDGPMGELLDECINAAIAELSAGAASTGPIGEVLDECINAAIADLCASDGSDGSLENVMDECINAAIAELSGGGVSSGPITELLDECINAAIAEIAGSSLSTTANSDLHELLDECLNAAIAQLQANDGTLGEDTLNEACNAGIQRAVADGIPGLTRDVYTATTYGDLSVTLDDAAVGLTQTSTKTGATGTGSEDHKDNIRPMDILEFGQDDVSPDRFVINEVNFTGGKAYMHLGGLLATAIADDAPATIHRRGIALPTSGKVISVFDVTNGRELPYDPIRRGLDPTATGTPVCFDQRWDKNAERSIVSLFPAPTAKTQVHIIQQENYLEDASIAFPEEALDAILTRAQAAHATFRGSVVSPVELEMLNRDVRDTDNQLKDSSSANKIFIRE